MRYVKPGLSGQYYTKLSPQEEQQFQAWWNDYSAKNRGMENPNAPNATYDYRGWFRAKLAGDPRAAQQTNANDNRLHFNDAWKTPYHHSFSNESIYALPSAPRWINEHQLADEKGNVMYDERPVGPKTQQLRKLQQQGVQPR